MYESNQQMLQILQTIYCETEIVESGLHRSTKSILLFFGSVASSIFDTIHIAGDLTNHIYISIFVQENSSFVLWFELCLVVVFSARLIYGSNCLWIQMKCAFSNSMPIIHQQTVIMHKFLYRMSLKMHKTVLRNLHLRWRIFLGLYTIDQ